MKRKLYLKCVNGYWYAEKHTKINGKIKRTTTSLNVKGSDKRLTAQRALHRLTLSDQNKGRFAPYLSEFVGQFLASVKASKKESTCIQYERNLYYCMQHLKDKPVDEYTAEEIETLKIRYSATLKPRTVNNRLMTLSALFQYAIRLEYATKNPVRVVGKMSAPRVNMPEVWDVKQFQEVLPYLDAQMQAAAGLGFYCGMRISEICQLRWIDIHDSHIVIRNSDTQRTKSDKPRNVPLPDQLKTILARVPRKTDKVVRKSDDTIRRKFNVAVIEAELPPIAFHGLRHSFATHCAKQGVPMPVLQRILGHGSIQTTMIYAHVTDTNVDIDWEL